MTYDLIILGGGPAGYLAAERVGHAGTKKAVIEDARLLQNASSRVTKDANCAQQR